VQRTSVFMGEKLPHKLMRDQVALKKIEAAILNSFDTRQNIYVTILLTAVNKQIKGKTISQYWMHWY